MSAAQTSIAGRTAGPWVYIRSEGSLWTVGFYDPKGQWQPESDHATANEADRRVHYLNGGTNADLVKALEELTHVSRSYIEHMDADDLAVLEHARAALASTKTGGGQ